MTPAPRKIALDFISVRKNTAIGLMSAMWLDLSPWVASIVNPGMPPLTVSEKLIALKIFRNRSRAENDKRAEAGRPAASRSG